MNCIKKVAIVSMILTIFFTSCVEQDVEVVDTKEVNAEAELSDSLSIMNSNIVNDPSNPELYHKRAKYHLRQGRLEEASNDIDRSIKLDSLKSDFHVTRGETFLRFGNITMARTAYEAAVQIEPKNIDGHIKLALYFLGLKDYSAALKSADNALRLDVNNPKTYFVKGRIFLASKDTTKALSSFQTATEMKTDYLEAFLLLGLINENRNDPVALNYYQSALEIDPNNTKALYGIGYFKMKQNRKDEAMQTFRRITAVNQSDPVPYFNIGYLHMANDHLDSSIYYYDIALNQSPEYYQAMYNRGLVYEELGDFEKAETDYRSALSIKPDYSLAISGLNRIIK